MAPVSTQSTQVAADIAVIKEQLTQLSEIKNTIETLSKGIVAYREEYVRDIAVVQQTATRAHSRLDEVQKDIERLSCELDEVYKLLPVIKFIAYVMAGISIPLTLAVLSYIWTLLTHGGLVLP